MRVASLSPGWRTDFILHHLDAEVREFADCIAVRTRSSPTFYWGNFLLLRESPTDDDLALWLQRFDSLIAAGCPEVQHVAIGMDTDRNELMLPAWKAAGFDCTDLVQLSLAPAGLIAPRRGARDQVQVQVNVQVRPIDLATEVERLLDVQCASNDGFEPIGYRHHRRGQLQRFATLATRGQAEWFGLWCDGQLAADCGLMRERGTALGRFQHVSTHPAWRRRGLCSALVHAVCAWGFEHWGLQQIAMCADADDVALGIYESLGFQASGAHWVLERRAPHDVAVAAAEPPTPLRD